MNEVRHFVDKILSTYTLENLITKHFVLNLFVDDSSSLIARDFANILRHFVCKNLMYSKSWKSFQKITNFYVLTFMYTCNFLTQYNMVLA